MDPDAPDAPSDAELIARVRAGDVDAYGELFSRHQHAAQRMARQLVPGADADDLASDAFAKVLDALRGGGGPDVSFRAYLLTTVRRVHVDRIRAGRKVQSTDDIAAYEREPEEFDDPTVLGFESGAAAKAFASLPERWQAVLWHTEVEGEKPATVAPLLGLTPNGVSALAYRAREGLRQAYLQQHLADVASDRCRWTTERLGGYVRGGLTKRENTTMREHIDECAKCTAVYLELVEVNSALPALLAPALLGSAGAGYLAASGVKLGGLAALFGRLKSQARDNAGRTAGVTAAVAAVIAAGLLGLFALTSGEQKPNPPAAIPPATKPAPPPVTNPTQPPPKTQPPKTQPTTAPTTAPSTRPTTAPTTPAPTTPRPTTPSPTTPSPTPSPTPTKPPPPVLYEGLLVISEPTAPAEPASVRDTRHERLITIKPPSRNKHPVLIQILYGNALRWPVDGNPTGWTCHRGSRTCSANNRAAPAPLAISFTAPDSGSGSARTYKVTARTGRLYDDDSETLPAPRLDEALLRLSVVFPDPDPEAYNRKIIVRPPARARGPVTVEISYGSALAWPFDHDPWGWSCRRSAGACTADNPRRPAPLFAEFEVPRGGSAAARTYVVTARVGLLFDHDSEKLDPLLDDEKLLKIRTPDWWNDPNPFAYNRWLSVPWLSRRVTLEISYGSALVWKKRYQHGWTCVRNTSARTGTCTTRDYRHAGRLNTEWDLRSPHASPGAREITVRAVVAGRTDTDTTRIP